MAFFLNVNESIGVLLYMDALSLYIYIMQEAYFGTQDMVLQHPGGRRSVFGRDMRAAMRTDIRADMRTDVRTDVQMLIRRGLQVGNMVR